MLAPVQGGLNCPEPNGHFPDPDDCRKFIHCDNYTPHEGKCGKGTVFDPVAMICNWPANVPGCEHAADDDMNSYDYEDTEEYHPKDNQIRK